MNLVLSLLFVGGGAAAVWAGITNPEGGLWNGLGRMIRGEPESQTTATTTGLLAGLNALAQAGRDAAGQGGGGGFGGGKGGKGGGGVPDGYGGVITGGTKAGAAAVAYAAKQIGKPYKWGAEGPDAFDCSGLTMRAWGAAGVSIPRTTTLQHTIGTDVKGKGYAPGDLIFPTLGHVQLYAGGGMVIEAPRTGLNVRRVPLGPVLMARRPHGGA